MQPSRLKFLRSLFRIYVHALQPLPPGGSPFAENYYYYIYFYYFCYLPLIVDNRPFQIFSRLPELVGRVLLVFFCYVFVAQYIYFFISQYI